uniref:Uncharacterized protein n=1 Tax=Arundo donax TaxID=35708 RepID=A0A0A8ZMC6_ARUDO
MNCSRMSHNGLADVFSIYRLASCV